MNDEQWEHILPKLPEVWDKSFLTHFPVDWDVSNESTSVSSEIAQIFQKQIETKIENMISAVSTLNSKENYFQTMWDKVQDSGKRHDFGTGSVRDYREGKGFYHLLPGEAMRYYIFTLDRFGANDVFDLQKGKLIERILFLINCNKFHVSSSGRRKRIKQELCFLLYDAMRTFGHSCVPANSSNHYFDWELLKRLAVHFENGAKKYGDRNWEHGQPVSAYYCSAFRHLIAEMQAKKDEDHQSAFIWNLFCMLETVIRVEKGLLPDTLDDLMSESDIGELIEKAPVLNKKTE